MTTYTFVTPYDSFRFRANFANAASPIQSNFDDYDDMDESWRPTGLQVADVGHCPDEAARCILASCGRDWYANPTDERDTETILDEVVSDSRLVAG